MLFTDGFPSQRAGPDSQLCGVGQGSGLQTRRIQIFVFWGKHLFIPTSMDKKYSHIHLNYQRMGNSVDRSREPEACSVDPLEACAGYVLGGWTGEGRRGSAPAAWPGCPPHLIRPKALGSGGKNVPTWHLTHKASPRNYY